jgi:hypothetical protein
MARRLDPALAETAARAAEPAPADTGRATDVWPAICEQFALRVLAASYQIGTHLEAAEADEQDPDRLDKLYRIDHANTRVRRQAENLQVLVGRRVEDASRQVTPLLDVVRASASAIEHYARIHIGQIVDLAVADFAADDVIRVLTELVDNATRFSPPAATVIVSAYVTEHGSVLVRVEDAGVGISPDQLPVLNAMLAGDTLPVLDGDPAAHLGLVVVRRLALAHQLRVHLTSRPATGTTATVLIPEVLLCEIPPAARNAPAPAQIPGPRRAAVPAHRAAGTGRTYQGGQPATTSHLMLVDDKPATGRPGPPLGDRPAPMAIDRPAPMAIDRPAPTGGNRPATPAAGHNGGPYDLPRRVPASLRGEAAPGKATGPTGPVAGRGPGQPVDREAWPDETADFAAGINDALWPVTDEKPEGYPR